MMDACDPDTFNAPPPAGIGPGTCVRSGGVQFATFLEQLGKHGTIGAWHFAPPDTSAAIGQVFVAMNRGGETHTFTEVETFGGGIVPPLNALSHNPVVARRMCGPRAGRLRRARWDLPRRAARPCGHGEVSVLHPSLDEAGSESRGEVMVSMSALDIQLNRRWSSLGGPSRPPRLYDASAGRASTRDLPHLITVRED